MDDYSIRRMKEDEVQLAVDLALKEGWNPGLQDARCFYQADPNGFFVGSLNGEPIAVASAIVYDKSFSFLGLYIVKQGFRGHGYGLKLTEELLKYTGNRITGLDGVLKNVSKYERLGFVVSHRQIRYEWKGKLSFTPSPNVIDIGTIPFPQLEAFDRKYFQAPRPNFLRSWIHQADCLALGYLNNQSLDGYGVIRKCYQGYKIGPLFAKSPEIAQTLFNALCMKANGEPVYLDIPEPNENARHLVELYKMIPKFEVMRMYRNGTPDINLDKCIYGITSFELG